MSDYKKTQRFAVAIKNHPYEDTWCLADGSDVRRNFENRSDAERRLALVKRNYIEGDEFHRALAEKLFVAEIECWNKHMNPVSTFGLMSDLKSQDNGNP